MTRSDHEKRQGFLTKFVCFGCRKVFKREVKVVGRRICPHCGERSFRVSHKFRAPKRSNDKEWRVVEYLVQSGFNYRQLPIKDENGCETGRAEYPTTMAEAKEFVANHKEAALKPGRVDESEWLKR